MEVRFVKALWGMEEPFDAALDRIRAAGYAGFETGVWGVEGRPGDLAFVGQLYEEDLDRLKAGFDRAEELGADLVNVHAGKDWWSFERGADFLEGALRAAEGRQFPVCFETHRGRLLFEPQSTRAYLERFPELRLTADFSHWTCVCESMLHDQQEAVDAAIARTGLVHARLGHEEGPQVNDPRAPRWSGQLERFCGWWDAVRAAHLSRGEDVLWVDPEFGPPNYMPTTPDGVPLADLWDVCLWMRDHLASRWG